MNIILCCQQSVFTHTGFPFSYSRPRWDLLSTFYIIIQETTTIKMSPYPLSVINMIILHLKLNFNVIMFQRC